MRQNIKAVAVDMNQRNMKAIHENLSHVDIVFDRYDISAPANPGYGRPTKGCVGSTRSGKKKLPAESKFIFLRNCANLIDPG